MHFKAPRGRVTALSARSQGAHPGPSGVRASRCGAATLGLAVLLGGCVTVPSAVDDARETAEPNPAAVSGATFAKEAQPAAASTTQVDVAPSAVPVGTEHIEDDDPDRPLEVITVTEEREFNANDRRQIYRRVAKGKNLYARKRIKEAFPYLLDTAQRGFKDAQARVGHIYLQGLGEVQRDPTQGVGWLGAASSGATSPGIRNYFNDIWKRIPENHVPYFEEVVEEYRSRYGEQATGVVCELKRPLRSFVKELGCFFEVALPDEIRETLEEQRENRESLELVEERLAEAQLVIDEQVRTGAGQTQ